MRHLKVDGGRGNRMRKGLLAMLLSTVPRIIKVPSREAMSP
jgi:hypothetical protein